MQRCFFFVFFRRIFDLPDQTNPARMMRKQHDNGTLLSILFFTLERLVGNHCNLIFSLMSLSQTEPHLLCRNWRCLPPSALLSNQKRMDLTAAPNKSTVFVSIYSAYWVARTSKYHPTVPECRPVIAAESVPCSSCKLLLYLLILPSLCVHDHLLRFVFVLWC